MKTSSAQDLGNQESASRLHHSRYHGLSPRSSGLSHVVFLRRRQLVRGLVAHTYTHTPETAIYFTGKVAVRPVLTGSFMLEVYSRV
eukprot:6322367-Amphidinium_carterae.1